MQISPRYINGLINYALGAESLIIFAGDIRFQFAIVDLADLVQVFVLLLVDVDSVDHFH
jgi:hypothetical protein